jgi:diguanylate cyclase (GGDEF)-like protein/PAS domain S-box-containing protein
MTNGKIRSLADAPPRGDQERMLKTLLGQLDAMVYRCRDDEFWTMEFVSEGCRSVTGYAPDELLFNSRISYEEVTHPEDRARVRTAIREAVAAGRRFDVVYRIIRSDQAVRWVVERGSGIFGPDGRLQAIQGFVEDITRRREDEQKLREAEARYRSIFENALEGIFQSTPDGKYLAANPALARIYGFDTPEALIAALQDIEHQLYVDPSRREEFIRQMQQHGKVTSFESQVRTRDGSVIWISENARAVLAPDGTVRYYEGTVEDITDRKTYEARIAHQATHDRLTGLPNRYLLQDRMDQAIRQAQRDKTHVGILFIDLDKLKFINDTYGHAAGDDMIRVVGKRLRRCLRTHDTVARVGGDEFILLLPGLMEVEAMAHAKRRVVEATSASWHHEGVELPMSCSVGDAIYPQDGKDAESLMKVADQAMYASKQGRR